MAAGSNKGGNGQRAGGFVLRYYYKLYFKQIHCSSWHTTFGKNTKKRSCPLTVGNLEEAPDPAWVAGYLSQQLRFKEATDRNCSSSCEFRQKFLKSSLHQRRSSRLPATELSLTFECGRLSALPEKYADVIARKGFIRPLAIIRTHTHAHTHDWVALHVPCSLHNSHLFFPTRINE